jgi:predicted short-subunit dehydrogenase-like oxidoreductase (DUF2520 family)
LNNTPDFIYDVVLVGAGNVAWHLCQEFTKAGFKISRIINRSEDPAKILAEISGSQWTTDFGISNKDTQFIVLAIGDSYLEQIVDKIDKSENIILHTSGSVGINIFFGKSARYGVLYPFQTLTKEVETDFSEIPVLTEACDEDTLKSIDYLASKISSKVVHMDSDQRRKLHLAGVISNNFTNHLFALTFDFLEKNEIDKSLILPLISETFRKLEKISPQMAQTGPARRNNQAIIESHLKMLEDEPELKYLYKAISDSIIAYYFR